MEKNKDVHDKIVEIYFGIDGLNQKIRQAEYLTDGYVLNIRATNDDIQILEKLSTISISLGELCQELIFGVVITKNKDKVVSDVQLPKYKPFLEGRDISRYLIRSVEKYLLYKPELRSSIKNTPYF